MRKKKILRVIFFSVACLITVYPVQPTYADGDMGLVVQGVGKTLFSAFQIPACMLQNATTMFPVGLLGGVVQGTYRMLTGTLSGVADIARGGAPYAKYLVFAL
jgi:hypothetical protein